MKKWIALLIASSLGTALAADKVHFGLVYVGFSTDLGDTTEVRFTASPYQLDVAVPIRLSSDSSYVYAAPQLGFAWKTNYWSPFGGGAGITAGANLGYNYLVNSDWRIYGEVGPSFYFGSGASVGWNAKFGASFTLR
ncbi:hypothetical protein [Deinococcus roseus]|uniref:Outer membrane protein beta-barrel domain-containing protein n=1 Tax=Deinococcus roseus TaxID=392414 RepID=A0ABQ2CZ36_9DEIO|nr:hypothetical protein [Deinococcus roseus]GGJ34630.1 hypothetical protein GCM10008938_21030 [Deinococcus roseus]